MAFFKSVEYMSGFCGIHKIMIFNVAQDEQ